jgi:two-component system, cell cycle sensor histidine kinase and response regulator CckA
MRDSRLRDPYRRVPGRALALSACALAVPLVATTVWGGALGEQEPLLWLLALVPGFLLAYYRGWRGASVALAAGMAALAVTHAVALVRGQGLPDSPLLIGVTAAFVMSVLGAGWTAELLHRRFLLAQEYSTDLTLIVDGSGTIRYASPSTRRILGFEPSSLEQRSLTSLLQTGAPAPDLEGSAGGVQELHLLSAEGSARVLEAAMENRLDDPRVGGWILRGRDVTERVRAEENHRRLYRMQAITQLAGTLAHDFNNVLTTIRGNAQLLQDEVVGNRTAERGLTEIAEASERASSFVDQLLAFTRQQVLRPRPLELNTVLEDTSPALRELLGPVTRLELALGDGVPQILMDPAQFRRILLIIAARAGERMRDGGEFRLRTARATITDLDAARYPYPVIPGDYAVLTATDTGPALSASAQAQIFEPFSVLLGEDSTGLELSSVYGTIKQSGGYVWVENEEGAGTSFRLVLPVAAVEAPSMDLPLLDGEQGMVLVAEDDAHVRAVVCRVLLKQGYYILEAADGEEALRLAEHLGKRLDLVVTDLAMPNMGGRELATALRRMHPDVPVLFMSGQRDGEPTTADDPVTDEVFIRKPFGPSELAAKLRAMNTLEPV